MADRPNQDRGRFAPVAAIHGYNSARGRATRRAGRRSTVMSVSPINRKRQPRNRGLLISQKKPLEPKHVWSIRVRLEMERSKRDLAIFNLAIDSKLRACDLVKLRVDDICSGANLRRRATIVQKKTGRPVQLEITEQSRSTVEAWLPILRRAGSRYLFPSRIHASPHISVRQYARLVHRWVESLGLESALYGTHSMRRAKAAQIYRKTGNLRAVQPRPYEAGEQRSIPRGRGR
jgi:site-specific recombinase XerC